MNPKPSLRRDSLERAAKKFLTKRGWIGLDDGASDGVVFDLVDFAQRHGAKVRREQFTPHEAQWIIDCLTFVGEQSIVSNCHKSVLRKAKALTPRGPEKGRRVR